MFKELFIESQSDLKDALKEIKKNGEVHIIMGDTDIWGNISDIENGIGYGLDQFDNDFEINLKKDRFEIVESTPTTKEISDLYDKIPSHYKSLTDKRDSIVAGLLKLGYKGQIMKLTDLVTDYVKNK